MLNRLAYRFHQTLERHFPEQRLFLKSETETRFIRLRPGTQILAIVGGTLALAWTIVATALIMMDSIGAGSAREQSVRQQALYEERLNTLSADRDLRAEEAAPAFAGHLAVERCGIRAEICPVAVAVDHGGHPVV